MPKLNAPTNVSSEAPTAFDDISRDFRAGSTWYDTTNKKHYLLTDNTDNAAVWRLIAQGDFWSRLASDTIAITGATTATADRLHIISGTSADYTITMPSTATTPTGAVVGFIVSDWSAADKQYTLDASGSVLIAGRTRYLILIHTNVALFRFNGTNWDPLVLNLDTPWINAGTMTITATTTNPSKGGGTTYDIVYWKRIGDTMHARYEYRQTTAGGAGSGTYLFAVPFGSINTNLVTANTGAASVNSKATAGVGNGAIDAGGSQSMLAVTVYDSTNVRLATEFAGAIMSSTSAQLSTSVIRFHFQAFLPIENW